MADRVLITMEDLETAVRANAAFEGAGYRTTMVSALDDLRAAIGRFHPELIVLSGGLREAALPGALSDAAGEAATLGLVESTDTDPELLGHVLGLSGILVKPVPVEEVV